MEHPVPKVGDTVHLNKHGLVQCYGSVVGHSHMMTKEMLITYVGEHSLTEPELTFQVEVDDPDINVFILDHWCFDIVQK